MFSTIGTLIFSNSIFGLRKLKTIFLIFSLIFVYDKKIGSSSSISSSRPQDDLDPKKYSKN
jgi:hypothetical protein